MSFSHNNPISNAIDFVSHGSKKNSIGNIEHQFNVTQTGPGYDPRNTALSGYSLQSDMLTSAYFNAEVGDLRETLGAYQIKVDSNGHRAIFVGGTNYRDGNSSTQVDVNVGNYPLDILDTDTNTGKSYAANQGIPNMTLKGNSFSRKMPIFPLTTQNNPAFVGKTINTDVLQQYQPVASIWDAIQLLKNLFSLSTIKLNIGINGNTTIGNSNLFDLDSNGLGSSLFDPTQNGNYIKTAISKTTTNNNCITYIREPGTGILGRSAFVSLTSAVTQWVKVCSIQVTIGDIINEVYDGLLDSTGNAIQIPTVTDFEVKLIIDGTYHPRQMIGNGMSHQQLFVWNETSVGNISTSMENSGSVSWLVGNYLQFDISNYLIYNKDSATDKVTNNLCTITRSHIDNNIITFSTPLGSGFTLPTIGQYLWVAGVDPLNTEVIYKVMGVSGNTITLHKPFSNTISNNTTTIQYYCASISNDSNKLQVMKCQRFNIDEIRDRYSMLQLLSHLSAIYKTATNLSLPLKLVEYMSQVVTNTNISLLLYYVSLCELYTSRTSSTVDVGRRLNQIFHFIQDETNFNTPLQGGNRGTALKYWNDLTDTVETSQEARFTCLNTNLELVEPISSSLVSQMKSFNIKRINKVKHVVVTNLPGFDNGRYGNSMSSSNLINGYFGSLSIDLSYSDTHTPVDVNGMTVHQWNYDTNINFNGSNNPARWNVNADENYKHLITNASTSL